MGNYTAIADTGKTLVAFLRRELVPEPVKREEDIGLCTPDDKGNYMVGLFLYDIEENPEIKNQEKIMLDREHFKNPPTSLNLYYMLFVSSEAEVVTRAIDEQRILGRAIQALGDYNRIDGEILVGTLAEYGEGFDIQSLVLPFDEKQRIQMMFEKKVFTSYFYKVGPVFIESKRIKRVKRVKSAEIVVQQKA